MLPEQQLSVPGKIIATVNTFREEPSEEIREQLIFLINQMINSDFQALVQLLYRIDIDERELKQLLKNNADINSASLITDLIIGRQVQKIATKKQFGKMEKPNPDDAW